jgi:tetratricopeptide (TPR) repeat protein
MKTFFKHGLNWILGLGVVGLLAWQGWAAAGANAWARQAAGALAGQSQGKLAAAPFGQPRAAAWLALEGLQQGGCSRALGLLGAEGERVSDLIYGQIAAECGEAERAARYWERGGGINQLIVAGWKAYFQRKYALSEIYFRTAWILTPEKAATGLIESLVREKKDYELVFYFLDQVLAKYPESPNRLEWLNNKGWYLLEIKRYYEAREVFEEALKIAPKDIWLLIGLGRADLGLGSNDKALERSHEVIRLFPDISNGYELLGDVFLAQGRYSDALKIYQYSIRKGANSVWIWLKCSDAALQAGEKHKAIQYYKEVIERFSEQLDAETIERLKEKIEKFEKGG